eukprot:g8060.t1
MADLAQEADALCCSVCGYDLESEFITAYAHPVLRVALCRVCAEAVRDGDAEVDEDAPIVEMTSALTRAQQRWTANAVSRDGSPGADVVAANRLLRCDAELREAERCLADTHVGGGGG